MKRQKQKKKLKQQKPDLIERRHSVKEQNNKPEEEQKPQTMPARSYILMLLAGAYLIYTGYKLCKNVIDGVEGGSWGFFAAGVGFLIVGIVMMVIGVKNAYLNDKEKKALAEQKQPEEITARENPEQKNMSIAERARLAGNLDDAPEETVAEEPAEGTEVPEVNLEKADSEKN